MKLYIKQKVFSWNDKFSVYDANGEERYFVEGEFFSWEKNCTYMTMHKGKWPSFDRKYLLFYRNLLCQWTVVTLRKS